MTSEANWEYEERSRLEMITAGCLALGYIIGLKGLDATPVLMLAKALKGIGCESSYIDDIIAMKVKGEG